MSSMEAESVNLIITDPPYGINFTHDHKTYNRDPKNVLKGYQEIETSDYLDFTKKWITEANRVLKEDGTMYIVTGYTHLREVLNVIHDTDLRLVSSLVWKYNFGVYATKKWINSHYHILMVGKDPKKIKYYPFQRYPEKYRDESGKSLNYADRESVWEIKREYWKNCLKTPTRLPYDLIEKMMVYSSDEGDLVLDPFMGSGQTAFVAKDLKRNYIGSEVVKEYCQFANKRVDTGQYLIPNIIIPDVDIPKEELTWLKKLTKKLTKTKITKE